MKNVLIWGLDKDISRSAFHVMEREKMICIKIWFGEPRTEVITHNWLEIVFSGLEKEERLQCDEELYQHMHQYLYIFMDMLSRAFYFENKGIHEYLNVFNLSLYYFYGLLTKNEIDLIIFDDIPHDPPNYMLYHLAKRMKIQTLIVSQSLFPDKFFYVFDVEDFGLFEQIEGCQSNKEKMSLAQEYKKELFYMNKPKLKEKIYEKTKIMFNFSKWKQQRMVTWRKTMQKYDGLKDYAEQTLCKKILKSHLKEKYQQNMLKYFTDKVDLTAKFIYFPLHLQPEMTTSALGGIYCDQLLAIERLANWIPEDWYIYVKENPKQTSFMRGPYFFERLDRITKVKRVGPNFNTYDLIQYSQFVGTITGTAGWEAISGGKNAVVFGKAWYRILPGVFQYSSELLLQEVMDYKIDHGELEEELELLLAKTGRGLINHDYRATLPQFDQQENDQKLVTFFKNVIVKLA